MLGISAVGCTPSGSVDSSDSLKTPTYMSNTNEFNDLLLGKAHKLAERELGRIMAAELLYRNVPEFFAPMHIGRQTTIPLWVKQYRHFQSYEIQDIYRSDSYLYPIVYEIHYIYDYLSTSIRDITIEKNAKELALNDNSFASKHPYLFINDSGRLVRRYRCNANGDYIEDLPELPPRSKYEFYSKGERIPENNEGIANPTPPK